MREEVRIEIAVSNPDAETLKRCRDIVDQLAVQHLLASVGGEIVGEGPVWRVTWWRWAPQDRGLVVPILHRQLDLHSPGWRELLTVG